MTSVYDFSAQTIAGKTRTLADFKGKVLLVVNTASKCGFTPQYKGPRRFTRSTRTGLGLLDFEHHSAIRIPAPKEIAEFCIDYGCVPECFKIDFSGARRHALFST